MKKLITLFLLASISASAYAQISPTTLEEYNYIIKGYEDAIASGQDMKKGYVMEKMGDPFISSSFEFHFSGLFRESSKQLAGIMVKAISIDMFKTKTRWHFCIPIGNKELLNRYSKEMAVMPEYMRTEYAKITSVLFANSFAELIELSKKVKK